MGANVLRLHTTQRDALRAFVQVRGSPFDSSRPQQRYRYCFALKRNLESPGGETRYGPGNEPSAGIAVLGERDFHGAAPRPVHPGGPPGLPGGWTL